MIVTIVYPELPKFSSASILVMMIIRILIMIIMNVDQENCSPWAAKVLISQSFGHDDNHDIQHDHHMHHDDHDVHDNYFPWAGKVLIGQYCGHYDNDIMLIKTIVYPELPKFSSASRWFSFVFASCSPFCSFTHSSISKKLICQWWCDSAFGNQNNKNDNVDNDHVPLLLLHAQLYL